MDTVNLGWPLAALLVILTLAAAAVTRVAAVGDWKSPLAAGARAVLQLALVSLVIGYVLTSMAWTIAFVGFMIAVATITSCRRITGRVGRQVWWLSLPILSGVLPVVGLIVASSAVPPEPVAVLPVAGILVGGAMTATTLAGRRVTEELHSHFGAYEAALSLGFTRRQAVGIVARPSASLALVPGLDQTRTVGLVTLPGAFVGMLLAGASPAHAGAAQLLVLIGLLAVQSIAVAVCLELVGAAVLPVGGRTLPG